MRLKQICSLVRLYLIFLIRKVLNFGFFKNIIFRFVLGIALIGLLVVMTKMISEFFVEIKDRELIALFLDMYAFNIVLWTFIVFLVMKTLFTRANELNKIMITFPIAQRERNAATVVFELIVMVVVIFLLSFSIVLSFLMKYEGQYFSQAVSNVFFLSLGSYLLLNIVYLSVNRLLNMLNLRKIKDIYNNFFIISLFVLYYNYFMKTFRAFSDNYLLGNYERENIVLIWGALTKEIGFGFTSIIFFIFLACSLCITVLVADNSHIVTKKFINIRYIGSKRGSFTYFKVYCLSLLRQNDYLNAVAISYIIFSFLLYFKVEGAIYAVVFVSFGCVYFYIQTTSIRNLQKKLHYSATSDYVYLIASQFVSTIFISLPLFLVYYLVFLNINNIVYTYLALLVSTIMFTFTGIVFPPKNENPFSVVISFIIIVIMIMLGIVATSLFQLSPLVTLLMYSCILVGMIVVSIYGLIKLQREDYQVKKPCT